MPRRPRVVLPHVPLHLIQRGNNRQICFVADEDYRFYLDWLKEYASKSGCRIHAYVLMTNHVHLLVSADRGESPGALMKALGQRYVQYFNRTYRRSGTLWEGRYRSCLTQAEDYLLACQRYIELNPVRAGMVALPAAWLWSSHAHYLGQRVDKLVTPHALYWALGNTPFAREAAYAGLVQAGIGSGDQAALTEAALSGWALGDAEFVAELQKKSPRRVAKAKAGRPAITPKN